MPREPDVPEANVPVVECLDGLARITSKELAPIHFVKGGTLQNACSTRPRVVVSLVKSAVAMLKKYDLQDRTWQPVVNRDDLKHGPVGRRSSSTRQVGLRISGHDAAEVYSPEGH